MANTPVIVGLILSNLEAFSSRFLTDLAENPSLDKLENVLKEVSESLDQTFINVAKEKLRIIDAPNITWLSKLKERALDIDPSIQFQFESKPFELDMNATQVKIDNRLAVLETELKKIQRPVSSPSHRNTWIQFVEEAESRLTRGITRFFDQLTSKHPIEFLYEYYKFFRAELDRFEEQRYDARETLIPFLDLKELIIHLSILNSKIKNLEKERVSLADLDLFEINNLLKHIELYVTFHFRSYQKQPVWKKGQPKETRRAIETENYRKWCEGEGTQDFYYRLSTLVKKNLEKIINADVVAELLASKDFNQFQALTQIAHHSRKVSDNMATTSVKVLIREYEAHFPKNLNRSKIELIKLRFEKFHELVDQYAAINAILPTEWKFYPLLYNNFANHISEYISDWIKDELSKGHIVKDIFNYFIKFIPQLERNLINRFISVDATYTYPKLISKVFLINIDDLNIEDSFYAQESQLISNNFSSFIVDIKDGKWMGCDPEAFSNSLWVTVNEQWKRYDLFKDEPRALTRLWKIWFERFNVLLNEITDIVDTLQPSENQDRFNYQKKYMLNRFGVFGSQYCVDMQDLLCNTIPNHVIDDAKHLTAKQSLDFLFSRFDDIAYLALINIAYPLRRLASQYFAILVNLNVKLLQDNSRRARFFKGLLNDNHRRKDIDATLSRINSLENALDLMLKSPPPPEDEENLREKEENLRGELKKASQTLKSQCEELLAGINPHTEPLDNDKQTKRHEEVESILKKLKLYPHLELESVINNNFQSVKKPLESDFKLYNRSLNEKDPRSLRLWECFLKIERYINASFSSFDDVHVDLREQYITRLCLEFLHEIDRHLQKTSPAEIAKIAPSIILSATNLDRIIESAIDKHARFLSTENAAAPDRIKKIISKKIGEFCGKISALLMTPQVPATVTNAVAPSESPLHSSIAPDSVSNHSTRPPSPTFFDVAASSVSKAGAKIASLF